jgi:Xaa-Pro aminopeptidase
MEPGSISILFSGDAPRKTADEDYPFFANRNFVYLTGIEQQESILLSEVHDNETSEMLFVLQPDLIAERWNGRRLTLVEVHDASGIQTIKYVDEFRAILSRIIDKNGVSQIYLDFDKLKSEEPDNDAYKLAKFIRDSYPFITLRNLQPQLRRQRTIKKPCEILAMREAERITSAGIIAMMKSSRPGMFEYQYKAEFDYELAQHGVLAPGFQSIISAGRNNFCIHYYSYRGQAQDGDLILNDVGACWDNEVNDVSRAWPCNGIFSDKQKLLYQCAYETSEHMFKILRPGMQMADVDQIIRRYNFEQLKSVGLCNDYDSVGKYMWHGGAHHVGYDVHDTVDYSMPLTSGMVFCVDIGIYCEEWGIGFRLEDNCLITDTGCENLSAVSPRTIEDIEAIMRNR